MSTNVRANWIYLFHGEDELTSHEAVSGLVARMKDSPMWEYNVTSFDGDKLSIDELANTCQTVPFLADKRLVIVTNLLSRLSDGGRGGPGRDESPQERAPRGSKKALSEALIALLPAVPDFCRLVFVEDQIIPEKDPVLRAVRGMGGFVKENRLDEGRVGFWIRERAKKIGATFSSEAVEELASAVGPNARLLNAEMVKLSTYCADRPVQARDVRLLVSDARKANVFAMVDAIGLRQPEAALGEMRRLLSEGDHPLRIAAMVIRQFRLLIQVKELSEKGASPDEIAGKVGMPFRGVAGVQRQARNFSFSQLEGAYARLLDFDTQVKTGAWEPDAALELLVMELIRG
ncbi:MAG TPA: DNA polymerase III subunit delta [Chloroflexota bacterium]